ncbi:hypothetical protein ABIC20_002400 [Methylobacterium radiotolerans]|uniref:Uncharacterized protein n=1 Tax=Methylobacterium radiotolerans TaxID=31998 RepID=A0ABV2NF21_9HYPH
MPGARPRSRRSRGGLRLSLCAELRGPEAPALAALRATTTLASATAAVWRRYERPGVVAARDRLAWARRALAALRDAPAAPPPGSP